MESHQATSRRAVLAGVLGGLGGWVAGAIERAAPVAAANGDVVTVGSNLSGAATTKISTPSEGFSAFWGHATNGAGSGVGVRGDTSSGSGHGVWGNAALSGTGVSGTSPNGAGVRGTSTTGIGVHGIGAAHGVLGTSTNNNGVYGESTTGLGVRGVSRDRAGVSGHSINRVGVLGTNDDGFSPAVAGLNQYKGTGVYGASGESELPTALPLNTGVLGVSANDSGSRGVHGKSTSGQGVRGEATTGVGVQAVAGTGVALAVSGRATFSRSGRASVAANRNYVDVTVPGGLATSANVLATLQTYRAGVFVTAARINYPSAGKVRIHLNKVASTTSTTAVAWIVLG